MSLIYLIAKEFKQMRRNSFIPRLILLFPCMIMFVMPWAATLDVEDLRIAVTDADNSPESGRLIRQIDASRFFNLVDICSNSSESQMLMDKDKVDIILEIPEGFEEDKENGQSPSLLVKVNAVDGIKGGLGNYYLQRMINPSRMDLSVRYLFNSNLDYRHFMVPALMAMLLVMICGFLPALNLVKEKEIGTIEQINVSPVSRFTFILSKLLPFWLVGFVVFTICITLAWLVYGITPEGNISVIYLSVMIFVFVISGLGLVISNYSSTMQQAMFVMWFCILVFILMSGLFTPISSMPDWAQTLTYANPLRYFIEIMRMVYLKGSTLLDITPRLTVLSAMAVSLYIAAIVTYKKQS